MTSKLRAPWCAALVAAVLVALTLLALPSWASDVVSFEAITPEIAVGDAVRVDIRVLDAGGQPVPFLVTTTALRLDMGPDGMAGMTTRVVAVPTDQPGVIALEADFTMAGRWALTLSATVNGGDVTGTVTLTAVKKAAEATPAAPAAGERQIIYYRHPMGLPDTSPVPKTDEMGMDYIPVYEDEVSGPPGSVTLTPEKIQRSGIRTVLATRAKVVPVVRGVGVTAIDERRQAMLSLKFEGFIEELYVAATGEVVSAGQPLAKVWIESPDILQKEADFLSSLRSGSSERAAANLRLFGIPDEVIAELRRSGTPVREFVLKAAHGGTVTDKQAVPGMRFAAGEPLYMVADLSRLWLTAAFSETDLAAITVGQTATARLNAGGTIASGRVAFVYPSLDMATRTGRVRIEIANQDGALKVGQYADVDIDVSGTATDVVAVPESAVLDSGRRQIVFIANDAGLFLPRNVTVGRRGDGMVEIRTGLSEGERVVVSGNFLLDAESNLRAALLGMTTAATP